MSLADLLDHERAIIGECLAWIASGEVILDDGEFPIVWGIEFSELRRVAARFPNLDDSDATTHAAIHGALVNLWGYPHGKMDQWSRHVSVPPAELARIFDKWSA